MILPQALKHMSKNRNIVSLTLEDDKNCGPSPAACICPGNSLLQLDYLYAPI